MNSLTVLSVVYFALQKIEEVHGSDSELTISNPSTETAYGGPGSSKVFSCELPNSSQIGANYEVMWLYKGPGDSKAMPMIGTGDVFNDQNERIIDGTITSNKADSKITTTLTIANIDPDAAGEYNCVIRYGRIYLSSTAVSLKVRAISSPPKTTNVAKGGEAKFTCKATGDTAATITFNKASDNTAVSSVEVTEATSGSIVTTTGVLTISGATVDDGIDYYCKASWGANEVKSANVFLSVLDMTSSTSTVWGLAGNVAEFQCKSAVELKKNQGGDPYLVNNNKAYAATQISWEFYDTGSSTWKSTDTDDRLTVQPPLTDKDGIRLSCLYVGNIQNDDEGLKVRCNIAYQADTDNNVFGGTVTSGELTMKIASITSFTASTTSPIVGESITLTCVATGGSAPTFSFTTDGGNTFDNTFLSTPVVETALSTDGTTYTVKYKTEAIKPNVLRSGQVIDCRADYGKGQKFKKDLTATNYYNCASATVKKLNSASNGATYTETDLGGGSLKQTIACAADTDTVRYKLITETNSAAEATCTKETGKYDKYLARCAKVEPLTTGKGTQTLTWESSWTAKPCSSGLDSGTSEYRTSIMKQKLNSLNDNNCGFRHKVKCLTEGKCTLDTTKSGCSYDEANNKLKLEYYVNFTPAVWTISEKEDLTGVTGGIIKFWDCSGTYS